MTKARFAPTRIFLTFVCLVGMVGRSAAAENLTSKKKPNIIVILADDLGYAELGCYGQKKIKTPHLDQLAAEGQRWTQFYSGAPVCSPSRNVLLTGRHTGGCNIQDLKRVNPKESVDQLGGDWPMDEKAYTLHMAMQKAGYTTAAFGKWGMGEYGTTGSPDKKGVDYFYGYTDHRVCHTFYPEFLWKNGVKEVINTPGIPGHAKQPDGEVDDSKYTGQIHASEAIMKEVLGYLDSKATAAKAGTPFFLYYCPLEPHVAMQPPREWVDRYPKEWDTTPYRGEKSYLPHSRPHAAYAATISYLDDHVGKVMAKLKSLSLDENTLVVFTSDNGTTHDVGGVDHQFFNSVDDLKGLKGSVYEGGIRVPGIIRWPGKVPAGKVVDQPAYSADLMPTLCALTGADAGNPYGENLLPVVLGEKDQLPKRRPMVWTGGGYGGQVAVRMGDVKALRRTLFKGNQGGPTSWEVYDLKQDRSESNDLADTRRDAINDAINILKAEYTLAPGYRELAIFEQEKKVGSGGPEQIFEGLDSNLDEKLSFEEWKLSPKAKANASGDKLQEIFGKLDQNADQFISEEEFLAQWKGAGK